jgi:hypothetical protein
MVVTPVVLNIAVAIHPYALRRHKRDGARPLTPRFLPGELEYVSGRPETPEWGFGQTVPVRPLCPRLQARRKPMQELMMQHFLCGLAPHLNEHRANSRAPFRSEQSRQLEPRRPTRREFLLQHAIMSHENDNPLLVYFAAAIRNAVTTSLKEKAA